MSRSVANLEESRDADIAESLADFMSEISEDVYCAGWLIGLENTLWGFVAYYREKPGVSDPPLFWQFGMSLFAEDDERTVKLSRLSERCGGWICFDDERGGATFVPLHEWLPRYEPNSFRELHTAAEWQTIQEDRFAELRQRWEAKK